MAYSNNNIMNDKKYFNKVANKWDLMRQAFFSDSLREKALKVAKVKDGEKAADIGAGTGFMTKILLEKNLSVIAIDQSEEMISILKQKFGENNKTEFVSGNAEQMNIPDNYVEYAFANMYLHHVEDPMVAIKEMTRILKPGGKLIITDLDEHNHEFLKTEQNDRWLGFGREDISKWFASANLKDIEVNCVDENCCSNSNTSDDKAEISIFIASGIK